MVHSRFITSLLGKSGTHWEMTAEMSTRQVSYRIDHTITVGDLLKDACNYWGSWSQLVAENSAGKGEMLPCCQCVERMSFESLRMFETSAPTLC